MRRVHRMATLVLKFGGSSVATIERIQMVAQRIAKLLPGNRCVVVLSAMGDETDILLQQAAALNPHHHPREYDMLLSTGEQKSIALLSMALREQKIAARSLTAWQAKIQTTAQHVHARIVHIDTQVIEECWKRNELPVIAGFQGVCDAEITTLGRGGSDLTATALAAALHADECQIFTDVDGVYSADPRIVSKAVRWSEITYPAMLELASVGAQVLHNRAVELACKMSVKLRVLSSFVEGEGTVVAHHIKKIATISGVATQDQQAVINLVYKHSEIYHHAFWSLLEQYKVSMGTVHVSRYQEFCLFSFALPVLHVDKVREAIQRLLLEDLQNLECCMNQAQISVIGVGIQSSERVFSQVHQWLGKSKLAIRLATSSESRFSFYVDETIARQVVKELHELFHLQEGNA